jgi:hypothetical protein
MEELENEVREMIRRRKELQAKQEWKAELRPGLAKIRKHLYDLFERDFREMKNLVENKYLEDSHLLANPAEILKLVEQDFDSLITTLGKVAGEKAAELHNQLETAAELKLGSFSAGVFADRRIDMNPTVSIKTAGWMQKSVQATKGAFYTAQPAGIIGGVLGGIVGAAVGFLFGGFGAGPGAIWGAQIGGSIFAVYGLGMGAREGLKTVKQADKREVQKVIGPMLEEGMRVCRTLIEDIIADLEKPIVLEIEKQLNQKLAECDQNLHMLSEARKLSATEANERLNGLKVPYREVTELIEKVDQLVTRIVHTCSETPQTEVNSVEWADE